MSFLQKLFGGRPNDAYQQGVALFEQGRAAEAIPLLEPVFLQDPRSPRGSLAGLYLRQAMVGEGRRLLQARDAEAADTILGRAADLWPDFPDLQFLRGAAAGLAGRWGQGLEAARLALRRNPDYGEARLLETCALAALERTQDAQASLLALRETGRRVESPLLRALPESDLPDTTTLMPLLRRAVVGDDAKQRLAEAVALCRAGDMASGLVIFAELAAEFPRYPDVRAKHAAVLYQVGRAGAALAEVDAALAVNSRYRTAVILRGLILAELGDVVAARDYLADAIPRLEGAAGRHEELFLAYLRALLALLLGDLAGCRQLLSGWHDLPRQFARAALLLAACDDLEGLPDAALRRLDELVAIWLGDAELHGLRIGLLLQQRQWAAAAAALAQWPSGKRGLDDPRPLYLRARLELAQGRQPILPAGFLSGPGRADAHDVAEENPPEPIATAAWRQLAIQTLLLRDEPAAAYKIALDQLAGGDADEETGALLLRAAAAAGAEPPADLATMIGEPDGMVAARCRLLREQGRGDEAEALVARHRRVRPDRTAWAWLAAAFWLEPVRRWLG